MVNPVTGTEFRTVQEKNNQGFIDRHLMYIDITFFEQTIVDYVEKNNPPDMERIVIVSKIPHNDIYLSNTTLIVLLESR